MDLLFYSGCLSAKSAYCPSFYAVDNKILLLILIKTTV
uniref:Uncharacterized protein n=1 Tax=uncultured Desulfobacterium sp. TaxID=201089 RepID=E1YJX8_9BACT|nr:unknown protein [uncultured Desulfobacterium sp.]